MFNLLPDDCISHILSFTSPRDTCRFATLSSLLRSAAESDQVWAQFLPSNYHDILSRADAPIHYSSKKDLFFRLCDPILIDDGKNSIALDKTTGNICYMISTKELVTGEDREYSTFLESRFVVCCTWLFTNMEERGDLDLELPFHVKAELRTIELSENTIYVVYLVYKVNETYVDSDSYFLDDLPVTYIKVGVEDEKNIPFHLPVAKSSCLIPKECVPWNILWNARVFESYYFPKEREGGQWMEVALGEFLNVNGVRGEKVFVDFNG